MGPYIVSLFTHMYETPKFKFAKMQGVEYPSIKSLKVGAHVARLSKRKMMIKS